MLDGAVERCNKIMVAGEFELVDDLLAAVKQSTSRVVGGAKCVSINYKGLEKFAATYRGEAVHWTAASPVNFFDLPLEAQLRVIFAFNSISFSYWGSPKWSVHFGGENYDGTWAMLLMLRRAIDSDPYALTPEWLSELTTARLASILASSSAIPLFRERLGILRELGRCVLEGYGGSFWRILEMANFEANSLVRTVVENFPSFRDTSEFRNKTVCFFKRAQLLAADIHFMLKERREGELKGWRNLTACADYKIPQVLRHLDIMSYSPRLSFLVDNMCEIRAGSEYEIEIRSSTVQSVDRLSVMLQERGYNVSAMELNDIFWLAGQGGHKEMKPYHRTRTVAY